MKKRQSEKVKNNNNSYTALYPIKIYDLVVPKRYRVQSEFHTLQERLDRTWKKWKKIESDRDFLEKDEEFKVISVLIKQVLLEQEIIIIDAFLMHWIPLWYMCEAPSTAVGCCSVTFGLRFRLCMFPPWGWLNQWKIQYMILLPGVTTDQCPVAGTSCWQLIPDICRWPGPGTCPPDTHVLACRAVAASVADAQYCWWVVLYITTYSWCFELLVGLSLPLWFDTQYCWWVVLYITTHSWCFELLVGLSLPLWFDIQYCWWVVLYITTHSWCFELLVGLPLPLWFDAQYCWWVVLNVTTHSWCFKLVAFWHTVKIQTHKRLKRNTVYYDKTQHANFCKAMKQDLNNT